MVQHCLIYLHAISLVRGHRLCQWRQHAGNGMAAVEGEEVRHRKEVRGSGRENLSESELRKKARGTGGRQTGGEEADGRRRGGQGKAQQQQRADSRRQEGRGEVEIEEAEQHNQSWFNSILVTIEDNLSYFDIDFNIFTEAAEQQQHGTENAPLLELVEAGVGHTDEPSR